MTKRTQVRGVGLALIGAAVFAGLIGAGGCASGGSGFEFLGSPFLTLGPRTAAGGDGTLGPSRGGGTAGGSGGLGTGSRTFVDPCTLPQSRKIVRISLRNQSEDFVHYFLVLVARINSGNNEGDGGVCPDDIDFYTSFGYTEVPDGDFQEFGSVCIEGPSLVYFHRGGQFRAGGGVNLASAISPAQGSNPTFDPFFSSGGVQVPVPDQIIFHNPGSGEGAQLKISENILSPCSLITTAGDPLCQQDAFYYVDESDLITGTTQLGIGSGRRAASEIQGTGCQCLGLNDISQALAPANVTANTARCNEFLRGGTIQYVFVREDQTPAFPQLVWRVTDATGALVQDFDERANIQ